MRGSYLRATRSNCHPEQSEGSSLELPSPLEGEGQGEGQASRAPLRLGPARRHPLLSLENKSVPNSHIFKWTTFVSSVFYCLSTGAIHTQASYDDILFEKTLLSPLD